VRYERVHLAGFGVELAPVVVTTEELEERLAPVYAALKIAPGQLEHWTGIVERRWWEPGASIVPGAAAAAARALEQTGIPSACVEALVYAGVCREHFEPATACHVAAALARAGHALPDHAVVHDVANACLGVLSAIVELANRVELGQIRCGMVVACESAREIGELTLRRLLAEPTMPAFTRSLATVTGGSGAVAVVVSDRGLAGGRRRLRGGALACAPEHDQLCRWGLAPTPDGALEPFFTTDAAAVLEHGVALGTRTWARFQATLPWDGLDRTICHQVGDAHRRAVLDRLGLAPEHDFVTYRFLGNTGSVALPMAAALAEQRGFVRPGHRVGWLGIGSGLNCMMLGVEW